MNNICQSCGMIMGSDEHGKNADGSISEDFCKYCYINGQFGKDETMEEMIESCISFRVNDNTYPNEGVARLMMMKEFPKLQRWSNKLV